MDFARALDHALYARIHDVWRARLLDALAPLLGTKWPWLPLVAAFFAYSAWRLGARSARLAALSLLVLLAADLSANLIKGEVRRLRPGRVAGMDPEADAGRKASFSFPSGAATNAFAVVTLWSAWHPELAAPLVAVAGAIGYSRVYAGEHYPADVAAGALLGASLGLAAAALGAGRRRTGVPSPPATPD